MAKSSISTTGRTTAEKKQTTKPYSGSMHNLRAFSTALMRAAELAPDRMSLGQLAFFLYAGMGDLADHPLTFTEIKQIAGERINKSLHTTYKVLLDGSRRSDRADTPGVGWLYTETDSTDNRRKLLRLTRKGAEIMAMIDESANFERKTK